MNGRQLATNVRLQNEKKRKKLTECVSINSLGVGIGIAVVVVVSVIAGGDGAATRGLIVLVAATSLGWSVLVAISDHREINKKVRTLGLKMPVAIVVRRQ